MRSFLSTMLVAGVVLAAAAILHLSMWGESTPPHNASIERTGNGLSAAAPDLVGQQPSAQKAASPPQAPLPVPAVGDPIYAPVASGGPQTLHEKFISYAILTAGPRALIAPLFAAAFRMAHPPSHFPPEWRQGAQAFGRNYGSSLAGHGAMQTGRFFAGALLHEDFRYRPSSSGNLFLRGLHAVGYTLIDKSDSGRTRIALANFAGAASGGYIGRLYLPSGFDDVSHADTRAAIRLGLFAGSNIAREFSPDVFKLSHRLHAPFPHIPIPEWWTGNMHKRP